MYLLNPYNDKNLYHSLNVNEIISCFSFRKKPTTKLRPAKRKIKRLNLEDCLKDIFNYSINYVIEGVLTGKFIFYFAHKKSEIKMVPVKNYKNYFKFYNVDPLEVDFQAYRPHFIIYKNNRNINRHINISKRYRNLVSERLIKQGNFETLNELSIEKLSKIVRAKFNQFTYIEIYKVLSRLFKIIRAATVNSIDIVFKYGNDVVFFRNDSTTRTQENKARRKFRFLYSFLETKYNGYYYFSLTYEQFNNRLKKENIYVSLHLIMHEAMLNQFKGPLIFRMRVPKPLVKKYTIFRNITYEKNRTKHIWRWNDKRFESVNDSKFSFN